MRLQTNLPSATRQLPKFGFVTYIGWAALLCAIEVLGRQSPNDLADSFLLSTFLLGMLFGWLYDPWHLLTKFTARVVISMRRMFAGARIVFGIDFQNTVALPAGFPNWWRRTLLGTAVVTTGLLLGSCVWSGDLRGWLMGGSYLVYLVVLGCLWAGLAAALMINGFLAFAVIHDFCVESYDGDKPRPLHGEIGLLAGALLASVLGTVLFGPAIPLIAILLGVTAWAVSFPWCPIGFSVQWAQKPGEPLQRFDGRWLWCQWGLLFFWTISLITLSCADRVWQVGPIPAAESMPVTLFLGSWLAWVSSVTVFVLLLHRLRMVWLTLQMDPNHPPLLPLRIQGRLSRSERTGLRVWFQRTGWSVRFGQQQTAENEVVILISADQLKSWRARGVWFLDTELLTSLCDADQMVTVKRRAEIQRRRQLLRGLERLFKRSKRAPRQGGSGHWLGMQHAFILGLARDGTGNVDWGREITILDEIIGMPFYAVIPAAARHQYRQMVQALQIDLIFVEDGVTFRRFVRVLRTLFEIFDVHGGRMPAREHHFDGLPGVRVILHEFELNQAQSHGRTSYPEPDYEEIGHARILHVFRDRGEAVEQVETPDTADWTPVGGSV